MRLTVHLSLLALTAAAGCAHRGNADVLEARLREQEDQLRSLHTQVDRTNSELTAARRLNDSLKQQIIRPASYDEPVDLREEYFRVTGLKINSLLTGGFDHDGQPGDDQVTLFFFPNDDRDQPVQVPGRVECELLDQSLEINQQRLGLWKFDATQTRAAWQKSLVGFGYRFELPWQTTPQSRDLELRVRFYSKHGDRFEASSPVRVTPPKSALGADKSMP